MKRIFFKITNQIFSVIFLFYFSSCVVKETENSISFEAMNTFMTVKSFGLESKSANQKVKEEILQLEKLISTTDTNSEISKFNNSQWNGYTKYGAFSRDTFELGRYAVEMANKTNGAFNPCLYGITSLWGFTNGEYKVPSQEKINELLQFTDYNKLNFYYSKDDEKSTLPENKEKFGFVYGDTEMKLDFGAIAKGYAGDNAIQILKNYGIKSAVLDLGGNVQVLGGKRLEDGSFTDWSVGIKNPDGGSPVAGIKLRNKAVITSGGYERFFTTDDGKKYIHIFDGKTGCPVKNNFLSVTIIADSGTYADSLSTALFVMGKEKAEKFWRENKDFDFIFLFNDGGISYSSGVEDKIFLLKNFNYVRVIR